MKTYEEIVFEVNEIHPCSEKEAAILYAEQFKPQWFSVAERLPENSQDVLIYTVKQKLIKKGFFILKDQWSRPNIFIAEMGYFSINDVTHWMPLPDAP